MAYKVVETAPASRDLAGILGYLAETLANPMAASALADEINACYDSLEQMPNLYALCQDVRLRKLGYRKVTIKNYIMIYRVSEANQSVYILRFFYGRRDYEKLL